jgi:hypothetical protein
MLDFSDIYHHKTINQIKNMNQPIKPISAALAAGLLLSVTSVSSQAAMLWYANFDGYSSNASINTSATPANDTFTTITLTQPTSGTTTNTAQTYNSGMAMLSSVNNTGGSPQTGNWILAQMNSFSTLNTFVLSFDAKASGNLLPFNVRAQTSNGTDVSNPIASTGTTILLRYTYVFNNTGSTITLPGTLGNLAANTAILYYTTNGTTFVSQGTQSTTGAANGFLILPNNTAAANTSYGTFFDNFGLWNNSSDTFDGISVLALAPHTVIPEPSSAALLICAGLAALFLIRRRGQARNHALKNI